MAQQDPSTLDEWIQRIRDEDMPIFGNTAREIAALAEDDTSSVSTLTQAVLQDAAMTAKLLTLANSAYFNPARNSISTVSRAVVVLGLDLVRGIVVSIRLIDTLLVGASHRRVVQHMARALHAAVQARSAAIARRDPSPEEVFIAAMLMSLGELAFWCFAGESGERLDAMLAQPGVKEEEAETAVLGFRISERVVDDSGTMLAAWLYATANTTHNISILKGPDTKLHHIGFRADDAKGLKAPSAVCWLVTAGTSQRVGWFDLPTATGKALLAAAGVCCCLRSLLLGGAANCWGSRWGSCVA